MNNKNIIIFLCAFIMLGALFSIISANKDITGEETEFVNAALAILNTGHPIFYQSEQIPTQVALWHPPMYIYLLSFIFDFSKTLLAARLFNVFTILLTSILIFYFCKEFFDKKGHIVGLISSALFLINYYVLSSSSLIDIDSLSTLFTFIFIYSILCYHKYPDKVLYLFASIISLVISLSNRYFIISLVFLSIFIYTLYNKETRGFSIKFLYIGFVGGVIFLIAWTIYSTIIEPNNFFYFFNHNVSLGSSQLSTLSIYLGSFALNISQIIRLFTLPVIILFVFSLFCFLKYKYLPVRTLIIYTLSIFLFFIFIPRPAFGYPRYFLTLTPGLFILISLFLYETLSNMKLKKEHIVLGLIVLISSLFLLLTLNPSQTLYRNDGLIKATNLPDFIFNILCSLPIVFVFLFKKKKEVFIFSLIFLLLGYNIFFDIKFIQNDSHIQEVGKYIKQNTNEFDIIIAPKAVAFYSERKFYANDYYKPALEKLSFSFIFEYIKNSYYDSSMQSQFFWGDDPYGGIIYSSYVKPDPEVYTAKYSVLNFKLTDYEYEAHIGDYYIYRLNN